MAGPISGITAATVGAPIDDNGVAPSGTRGIPLSGNSPYRANDVIPGADSGPVGNASFGGGGQGVAAYGAEGEGEVLEYINPEMDRDSEFVAIGRRCYQTGLDYYKQGWQTQHINNAHHFKGRHEPGSKYNHEAFKLRSKLFRPQTRSAARAWEADVSSALFMNEDFMHVSPENVKDQKAEMSAAVLKQVMNLRLKKNWFTVCMGAAQDTFVNGPVISKVYWAQEFAQRTVNTPVLDEMGRATGIVMPAIEITTVRNEPVIELITPECFLYDPTASWVDVVGTAGYIVHRKRVSLQDVQRKMDLGEWHVYDEGVIQGCRWSDDDDAVNRSKRGEGKPDPADNDDADNKFNTIMILEIFLRKDGIEYVYDMLGERFMLSDPVELRERYAHGRRPFSYGTSMIESHNTMPDSKAEIASDLQREINDISNNRIDNVRLAMNKRFLAKRNAQIDIGSLTRSVPGSITFTNNPVGDVVPMEVNDVTASSYQETDVLTNQMNELTGTFSQQAVQNNRQLNETVGGMQLISSAATKVSDYDIRTFVYTWVEPTLTLFMLTCQYYEDDEMILQLASQDAEGFPELLPEDLDDDLLTKQLMLSVDVGLGATDPMQRINTLLYGVETAMTMPGMAEHLDGKAVAADIFAQLGRDGSKYFPNLDKNFKEPEQAEPVPDPLVQAAQEDAKGRVQQAQIQQEGENQRFQLKLQSDEKIAMLKLALDSEMADKDIQSTMWFKMLDNETKLRIAAAQDKTRRETVVVQQGQRNVDNIPAAVDNIANTPSTTQQELNNANART